MLPSLLAIDWGTTSARAYAMDAQGDIVSEQSAPLGITRVRDGKFMQALETICGGVIPADLPLIACGMIGSRQGWIEAPYRECPASFEVIAAGLVRVPGTPMAIVPGLICREDTGVPDVMRGEETQVFGALADRSAERRAIVLPGTHSKWVIAGEEGIETFASFMTGELYQVLREHSILGRLALEGTDDAALERGVRHSLRQGSALLHDLFSARALALTGELASEGVADYLSGLLLGAEIVAARGWLELHKLSDGMVSVIGDTNLVERYRRALALAGIDSTPGPAAAAAHGLWRIAQYAGMVSA